jgi:chromosome segregation ATPase
MTVQNPRTLIVILNDLIEDLRRWKMTTRDTLTNMSWHQRQGEEKVIQAQYHAAIVRDQADKDQQEVDYAKSEVEQLLSKCYQAQENARQNLVQAQQAQKRAKSTLSHWQEELQLALAWLAQAEARLRIAITERVAAENNLNSAYYSLQSAKSELSSCENSGYTDKEGKYHAPNCSSQRAAVSNAQANVSQAQNRLNAAIAEEKAAEKEVRQAKARINCCTNAVGYGQQAVSSANIALNYANDALSFAEHSLENAQAASRAVEQAQIEAISEQEMADLMSLAVNTAQRFTNESRRDFQEAQHLGDSAQRLEIAVSKELEQRVEYLIELNRPFQF